MRRRVATSWPPEEHATIDRLAFLAAKPYLMRRSWPWWLQLIRLLDVRAAPEGSDAMPRQPMAKHYAAARMVRPGSPRPPVGVTSEVRSERMRHYMCACELAAAELSAEERVKLRERGELPRWFWRALDEHAAEARARA